MSEEKTTQELEIEHMQIEWLSAYRTRRRTILVENGDGTCEVHQHTVDGVAPPTDYPTVDAAARRVLQMVGIKVPVVPQDWPERVQIGSVEPAQQEPDA